MAQKVDYAALKKGGYMRQKQKGYGSLRLAVIGGNLTAENIKKVAEVAEKYGRGYVHMTSRQGIEIPCAVHVSVPSQPARDQKSVPADVSTPTHWQKNWMPDISGGNFRISSNSVLPDVRITV